MVKQLTIEQLEEELSSLPNDALSHFTFDVGRPEAIVTFIDKLVHQATMDLEEARRANSILDSNEIGARLSCKLGQPQTTIEAKCKGMDFSLRTALLVQRRAHDLWPESETSEQIDKGILALKIGFAEVDAMRRHPSFTTVH